MSEKEDFNGQQAYIDFSALATEELELAFTSAPDEPPVTHQVVLEFDADPLAKLIRDDPMEYIRRFGGSLEVTSEAGETATFEILPGGEGMDAFQQWMKERTANE